MNTHVQNMSSDSASIRRLQQRLSTILGRSDNIYLSGHVERRGDECFIRFSGCRHSQVIQDCMRALYPESQMRHKKIEGDECYVDVYDYPITAEQAKTFTLNRTMTMALVSELRDEIVGLGAGRC